MPNKAVQEQIEKLELIIAVNAMRASADPHKLPPYMLDLAEDRLANLLATELVVFGAGSARAGASMKVRDALDELRALHQEGYNFINGLLRSVISAADRLALFVLYGWESGEVGDFDDSRIEAMASRAIAVTPNVTNPAHQYPAALITAIAAQREIVNDNQPAAAAGTQAATEARDEALGLAEAITERVRHHYCAASDLRAKNPELARIGFKVARDPGEVTPESPGPVAGTPVYDAAQKKITIQAIPDRAAYIRSFRRAIGGAPEAAGVSNTTTVSVVQYTPLTPGTTYEFWVVGVDGDGDEGPESEHVTHTEPVGP